MMKLALVFGGESCEHDISIITGLSVYYGINTMYDVTLVYRKNGVFYIGKKLSELATYKNFNEKGLKEVIFKEGKIFVKNVCGYKSKKLDAALICCHGGNGENGALSGYFEMAGIPYTCSGVFGSSLCMDKAFGKLMLEKLGYPVVDYRIYHKGEDTASLEELGYPLIIKPAHLGSSVGITFASNHEELIVGIEMSLKYDEKLLVEKALTHFKEFNCAACLYGDKVVTSEIEQPIFNEHFLNFYDKYINSKPQREIPAKLNEKIRKQIIDFSQRIYADLELKGAVRIDYLFCDNKLYVNEINTIPGSLATYLFKYNDIDVLTLTQYTVDSAIKEYKKSLTLERDYSSNVLDNLDEKSLFEANRLKK